MWQLVYYGYKLVEKLTFSIMKINAEVEYISIVCTTNSNISVHDISFVQNIFIATNIKHLTYPHLNSKIPRKIKHDQHYKNV